MSILKINYLLSDEELEQCIEGSTDLKVVRKFIDECQYQNLVNPKKFENKFGDFLQSFICEEDDEDFSIADINNRIWAKQIAENINDLILDKWTKM